MVRRSRWMFLGSSAFTGAFLVWSSLAGCQPDETLPASTQSGSGGSSGAGVPASGGKGAATSSSNSTSTSAGAGGQGGSEPGKAATIKDITTGVVGPGIKVKITGVIAMSQKFLISKGSTSGSCLWGIFVSAPNLTETAPNSGILVAAYGVNASIPPGETKAFCPRLDTGVPGDAIPNDTRPGDVLDIVGETSYFRLSNCDDKVKNPGASDVAQYQISQTSSVTKTGTTTLPTPHVMTESEIAQLASPSAMDKAFHDQWGGVKVRIANVTSVPQNTGTGTTDGGTEDGGAATGTITDQFGHIFVMGSNLQVGNKIYFRPYQKQEFCFNAPVYPATTTFTSIDGFSYLDFCTWSLVPNDKCADLAPPSADALDCNGKAQACTK